MTAAVGWLLAVGALFAGWYGYGWPGLAMALSAIVFWLLLQFSRSLRVLRQASGAPVGSVASAVMLHSKLQRGMRLGDVIGLTHSLGERLAETPETWGWRDEGGNRVRIEFDGGRCVGWSLQRAEDDAPAESAPP